MPLAFACFYCCDFKSVFQAHFDEFIMKTGSVGFFRCVFMRTKNYWTNSNALTWILAVLFSSKTFRSLPSLCSQKSSATRVYCFIFSLFFFYVWFVFWWRKFMPRDKNYLVKFSWRHRILFEFILCQHEIWDAQRKPTTFSLFFGEFYHICLESLENV